MRKVFAALLLETPPPTHPPGMHWKGGAPVQGAQGRPATVSLVASASFNGICNQQ